MYRSSFKTLVNQRGLTQGSALSPLLELISRKIGTKDIHRNLLNGDNLAVGADPQVYTNDRVGNNMLSTPKVNFGKTEVMWLGQRRKELEIRFICFVVKKSTRLGYCYAVARSVSRHLIRFVDTLYMVNECQRRL